MKKNRLANRISDSMEISRDIIADLPRVVVIGNGLITIEGFTALLEYTEEKTDVKTKSGVVMITGKALTIDEISEERIALKGEIYSIKLL